MLVPIQGGVANLQKRNRQIFEQEAALATVEIPSVYIFNVGPRKWTGVGGGKSYTIPPCPKDRAYSDPIEVSRLCASEYDPADGASNMGVLIDAGMSGVRKLGKGANATEKHVIGVANDVIGTNSTTTGLDLYTTNGEWFGIFVTANEEPTDEELDEARGKLRQMMELIYATGAEKVQQGEKVDMMDRRNYNEAAILLGKKSLWGSLEHTRATCPECHEDIIEGANFCKHCQQAIDPASVQARAAKRAKENKKLLSEEETAS
jgi:hypothetical protein